MNRIDTYKKTLGYGARANIWELEFQFPSSLLALGQANEVIQATGNQINTAINNGITNINNFITGKNQPVDFQSQETIINSVTPTYPLSMDLNSLLSLMVHDVNFPKQPDIEVDTIAYEGSYFNLAKERKDYDNITIKFRDDTSFILRNLMEVWMNYCQNQKVRSANGVMNSPLVYKTDVFKIYTLDNELKKSKYVNCFGVFPISVSSFELTQDEGKVIETSVEFSVDSIDGYGKSITTKNFKILTL